ncbi:MAG TPA: gluconate 2-dehydrogenase subunit 3 family protein [Chitinophagaceae bacterium]|nr:gluconate 2-dehydrogenase subunit 3 family protein [Chitinophagaceae bacterium]
MDRRQSLKALAVGTVSAGLLLDACKTADKKADVGTAKPEGPKAEGPDRYGEEIEHYKQVTSKTFFTEHEMATIAILADIIIPKDDVSGSATDAKVPDFIEFIVKDMPHYQVPMRGGLRWLDMQSLKMFDKAFRDSTPEQRIQLVDMIAYPKKAKPDMAQGVYFFNTMRDLTCTGFYTSEIGVKDIGYMGNQPNQWNGVPEDVLKQYNLTYTEKELKECVKYT